MKHLFIDRQHIEMTFGIQQVFHSPRKHPLPLLTPEAPWEDCQVRIDRPPLWNAQRGVWQMWYSGGNTLLPLYAESSDGLNWERPALGRVNWQGSSANNIVNVRETKSQEEASTIPHSLMIRDDTDPDPARRYKGCGWFREKGVGSYLKTFISPDGFDWTPLEGDRVFSEDTKRLMHDTLRDRYVLTVKGLTGCGVKKYGAAELGRIVYLSVSDDFCHWTEPELIFHADEADQRLGQEHIEEAIRNPDRRGPVAVQANEFFTDVYFLPLFVYEDLYLGLPPLFHQSGHFFSSGGSNQDGILSPTLVASRDLHTWDRLDRRPFIRPSPLSDPHLFDHGCIYASPPARNGDELWFTYHGARYSHINPEMIDALKPSPDEATAGIFLARLRVDGFASLAARREPGHLLTKPLTVTGSRLVINADAAGGELKVEVRDALTGRGIPGFSMGDYMGSRVLWSEDGKRGRLRIGAGARFEDDPEGDDTIAFREDRTAAEMQWRGGRTLAELQGREVRLFFQLCNAELYSFWLEP